jgi:superfamily I DNA/RNA helicase
MAESLKRGMVSKRAEAGIRQVLGLLQAYRGRLRERREPLHAIVSDLIVHSGYQDEVVRTSKSAAQAELRRSNLNAVVDAVSTYEGSVKKPTLSGFLDASSLNNDADRKAEDRKPDDAVSLMTIHSAKGLEFPYVFVVGVEDGLMPHFKNTEGHGLEEERRLFYVALTRGMKHVVLSEALSRTRHGRDRLSKPSRFLKELPENLVQPHIRAARDMVVARIDPPKPKKKPRRRART